VGPTPVLLLLNVTCFFETVLLAHLATICDAFVHVEGADFQLMLYILNVIVVLVMTGV